MSKKRCKYKGSNILQGAAGSGACENVDVRDVLDNRMLFGIILISALIAGIFLRVYFIKDVIYYRTGADENFYLTYAKYMAQEKGASLKALSEQYLNNKEWQLFPNPLRAGHILISSYWMKAWNRFDFGSLSYLSAFFSILTLFVVYLFTRRLFDKKTALYALLLFVSSPISLALARRALQDSAVCFFTILAIYTFYLVLHKNTVFFNICFAASFYMAMTVKETSILLLLFFISSLLFERTFFRKDLKVLPIFLGLSAASAGAFFSYLAATGGMDNLKKMVSVILLSPATNEYAIIYQTGNFFRYIYDFFLVSPVTAVLSVIFLALYVVNEKFHDESHRYLVFFFVVLYTAFSFFSKNLRYVIALDVPIRITSAVLISYLAGRLIKRPAVAILIVIAGLAAADFLIFRKLFLIHNVYDPVTYELLAAWNGIAR